MRLGAEFQDVSDAKVLLRALDLKTIAEADTVLAAITPWIVYPARVRYVLEELLSTQ